MVQRVRRDPDSQQELLSKTLKLVRRIRCLEARNVAAAMNLPLRSYYGFEAGHGSFDLAKIWAFAEATDSDPVAILLSVLLRSPDFALRCMDSKAASIMLAAFRGFDSRVGDRMTHLRSAHLIEAFKRAFDQLELHLDRRDEGAERWLAENLLKDPPPR